MTSEIDRLRELPDDRKRAFLAGLNPRDALALVYHWPSWARPEQLPPSGTWTTWLYLAGRGSGKSRSAAEFITDQVLSGKRRRVALIGEDPAAARDVMIEGQALAVRTKIPTPTGWRAMQDLRPGHEIFAGDGSVCRVLWNSEVHTDRPCYSVSFSNGERVVADANHQWPVRDLQSTRAFVVRTTEEISRYVRHNAGQYRYAVIPHQGIDCGPDVPLPMDPYCIGAWLGDGHSYHAAMTTMDAEVLEGFRKAGWETREWPSSDNGKARTYGVLGGFKRALRDIGVLADKHLPAGYLRASRGQRLAVVQGLMDTDGFCSERGQCEFTNTNPRISWALRSLLSSLGIVHRTTVKDRTAEGYKLSYRTRFTTTQEVFTIERKRVRLSRDVGYCSIVEVTPTQAEPVCCIAVDHPSGTFLFGDSMLPTHNSGLCRVGHPHTRPKYEPSKRRLTWPNGAIATVFSAENPDALRGPEHDLFWGDEVAAYGRKLREVLDNLRFGLRLVGPLGHEPCGILTTTPRPLQILRDIRDDPTTVVSTGSTYGNLQNLAPAFRDAILSKYEGTRIGRQEIYAEILDDIEGALWSTALIESTRRPALDRGQYTRIVVAVDPQITKGAAHAETGIVVVGKDEDDHCDILEDLSFDATPNEWAVVARDAYYRWKADRVVAEVNQGGDMVFNTMRILDHRVACKKVRATRGKRVRAEPVAALYERGLVHHVEPFVALEKQLCLWTGDPSDQSPDRMDAMVWGVTELVLGNTFAFV